MLNVFASDFYGIIQPAPFHLAIPARADGSWCGGKLMHQPRQMFLSAFNNRCWKHSMINGGRWTGGNCVHDGFLRRAPIFFRAATSARWPSTARQRPRHERLRGRFTSSSAFIIEEGCPWNAWRVVSSMRRGPALGVQDHHRRPKVVDKGKGDGCSSTPRHWRHRASQKSRRKCAPGDVVLVTAIWGVTAWRSGRARGLGILKAR